MWLLWFRPARRRPSRAETRPVQTAPACAYFSLDFAPFLSLLASLHAIVPEKQQSEGKEEEREERRQRQEMLREFGPLPEVCLGGL